MRWLISDADGVNCVVAESREALAGLGYSEVQVAAAEEVGEPVEGKAWAGTSAECDLADEERAAAEAFLARLPEGVVDLLAEMAAAKLATP